jgi:phosphonatase-like hydrolase
MKSQPFQLAVVDLVCTFAGAGDLTARLLAEAFVRHGNDASYEAVRGVVGLPLRRAIAALSRTGAGVHADAERADRVHDDVVAALVAELARPGSGGEIEGVSQTFATLRARGLRIAVATVMPREVANALLISADWFDRGLVDTVVVAEDVDAPRPQPGMIIEAMARTGVVDPRRVIKVGDTPADLAEGTIGGCGVVVGLTSGIHSRDELLLRPHTHLIDRMASLVELAAPAGLAQMGSTMPHLQPQGVG